MLSSINAEELEQQIISVATDIPMDVVNFTKCNFVNCDLSDYRFSGILDSCKFIECNLSLASFRDAMLQDVSFNNCKLVGVDFTLVNKLGLQVNFSECLLRSCNFNFLEIKKTDFSKCELIDIDFIGTNLTGSNFSHVNFNSVTFHDTNLTKANFTDAHNYSINPLTNQIKGALFSLPDAVSLLECMGIKLQP